MEWIPASWSGRGGGEGGWWGVTKRGGWRRLQKGRYCRDFKTGFKITQWVIIQFVMSFVEYKRGVVTSRPALGKGSSAP